MSFDFLMSNMKNLYKEIHLKVYTYFKNVVAKIGKIHDSEMFFLIIQHTVSDVCKSN